MRTSPLRCFSLCLLALLFVAPGARSDEGDQATLDKQIQADRRPAVRPAARKNLSADDWSNTLRGQLDASDEQLSSDQTYYETWEHHGIAGEIVTFELKSVDFDPYLMFFLPEGDDYTKLGEDNDSGLGRTARIQIRLEKSATYEVMVNTARTGETGWYTLHVRSQRPAPPAVGPGRSARIALDQRRLGRLERGDPKFRDGSYYDEWHFHATRGETVTFRMKSMDFNTYMILGRMEQGNFVKLHETSSDFLSYQFPASGAYVLQANSFAADQTGDYGLSVLREAASPPTSSDWDAMYPGGGDPRGAYALIVGINDYPGEDADLSSCVADAQLFRDLLIDQFGYTPENVVTIIDQEATRDHIIAAFRRHLGQAGPHGTAVFYYSGHGTRVDDARTAGDEVDGLDEALALWGAAPRGTYLIDDELGTLLSRLRTNRKLVVLDSCFSGTATRALDFDGPGAQVKSIDFKDAQNLYDAPAELILDEGGATRAFARGHILLAASADDQESLAQPSGGPWPRHGGLASVFTYHLVDRLVRIDDATTFAAAMADVSAEVEVFTTMLGATHVPQLEGEGTDRSIVEFLTGR